MGLPMAQRLHDAGHELVVYDINTDAVQRLTSQGAQQGTSPADVADRVETVLTSLPTPPVVEAVVLGPDGLVHGSTIKNWIDLSTTGAPTTERLAAALADRAIQAVDSPVSGGVPGATAGTLALMVACPQANFALASEIVSHLGKVFYVGDRPGQGQTMKLLNNYLSATALATTAEAFVFGAKAGLDAQIMVDVVNASSGRNSATQDKFPQAILPGTFDFGFAIGLMCKDLRLFAEQAERMGVPLWIGSATRQLWQHTSDQLGADADFTQIVKPYEAWAQVEVRAEPGPPA